MESQALDQFMGLSGTAWTGIYTLITAGLLAAAVWAALYAKRQWTIARDQVRESNRPYVIVTAEASGAGPQLFDLVVRNIGHRPAKNVTVKLDPPPKRVHETEGHEITKIKMLNEPIAMIAPGQELRTFYDSHIDRHGASDVPSVHQVLLTYEDSNGEHYTEPSVVDIDALEGTMHPRVKTVHDIGKTLEKMQQTLGRSSVLQRNGGLRVEASVESRDAQQRRFAEENAEREEAGNRLMEQLFPQADENPTGPSAE